MANLKMTTALKYGTLSQKEFAEQNGNITLSALDYAMANDLIDYTRLQNNVRLIVLTPKTLEYQPNKSRRRPSVMAT